MSTLAKYPKATTITIYSLGIFLGLLHIFFGVISLTPLISHDYHREMKINYNAFTKSLTFLHAFVEKASLAFYLRWTISACQILFGLLLAENGHFIRSGLNKLSNYALVVINIVFFLLQLNVGSSLDRIAPTVFFEIFLVARLIIIAGAPKKPTKSGPKPRNQRKITPKKNKSD